MAQLNFSLRRVAKEIENFQNNKHYLMIYDKYLNLFTQLEVTQNYPFNPYNVINFNSKNKVPYLNNLNNLTEIFKNRDKIYYIFFFRCMYSLNPKFLNLNKQECYCCKSMMCKNEWCPSFTFINLLLELIEVKFIECYSSNLSYRYIKNIYDKLFVKLPDELIINYFLF